MGVDGLENFVPNPEAVLHGYTLMYGLVAWPTATHVPAALNLTESPFPVGSVTGLEYFVPKPELVVQV
jgi:hypothetical protein